MKNWVDEAIDKEVKLFRLQSKHYIDKRLWEEETLPNGYKHDFLSDAEAETFENKFFRTLKYPNIEVWDDLNDTDWGYTSFGQNTFSSFMDSVKETAEDKNEKLINIVCVYRTIHKDKIMGYFIIYRDYYPNED